MKKMNRTTASLFTEKNSFPILKQMIEYASDPVIITDTEGFAVYYNPAAVATFGTLHGGVSIKNISSISFEQEMINVSNNLVKGGSEYLGKEAVFSSKNGFFKSFVKILPIPDNEGQIKHLLFHIHGTIEKENDQNHLSASLEQFHNILEPSTGIIIIMNGSEIQSCNKSLLDFFCVSSLEELKVKEKQLCNMFVPLNGYLRVDNNDDWVNHLLNNKATGKETKIVLKKPDTGMFHYFLADLQLFPGEKKLYLVSFTDITETESQKNKLGDTNTTLEEAVSRHSRELFESYRKLASSEEIHSVIFNMASIGITMADSNGILLRVNKKFCDIYRITESEIINKHSSVAVHPNMRGIVNQAFIKYRDGTINGLASEWKVVRNDGSVIDVLLTTKWVTMYNGKRYLISTHIDMTDKNKLQEKQREQERVLVQQSKMATMGEMIGAIAHQWKQPLNAIALIAQCLKDDFEFNELNEEELNESVGGIMKQVLFMSATIDDFRNFFKPAKTSQIFDTYEAVSDIVNLMLPQLKVNFIEVNINKNGAKKYGSLVSGFSNEFKQAILNLIVNSKDVISEQRKNKVIAGDDAGIINIGIKSDAKTVQLIFSDNGGGVPERVIDKLFEPYFTTKGSGSGIGLYMTRTIIESKMGGVISVRNNDAGAEFTIILRRYSRGKNEKIS